MPEEDRITLQLGLPELRVLAQHERDGEHHLRVESVEAGLWCDECDRPALHETDHRWRTVQDLPIYDHPVFFHVRVRTCRCGECGERVFESFDFVKPRARKTKRLQAAVREQARGGRTVQEVAKAYRIGYHAAFDATFKHAGRGRPRSLPRLLGIDEFAKRKGHNYDSILVDLESHRTIDVVEGRKKNDVVAYLNSRTEADRQRVEAVCADMSDAFAGAIREALPHATLVTDRFHVMQLAAGKVDEVRRTLQKALPKGEKRPLFEARKDFTKPPQKLTEKRLLRRDSLLREHPPLAEAAAVVTDLRQWYGRSYKYLGAADTALGKIVDRAAESEQKPLRTLADTLNEWRASIVAFMKYRITNGPTEGTNNKVKTIKRQAYGHRNRRYLNSRILAQMA